VTHKAAVFDPCSFCFRNYDRAAFRELSDITFRGMTEFNSDGWSSREPGPSKPFSPDNLVGLGLHPPFPRVIHYAAQAQVTCVPSDGPALPNVMTLVAIATPLSLQLDASMTYVARRGIVSGVRMPECLCDETRSVLYRKTTRLFLKVMQAT